jgi:serine/threonine protein phosphatase PrpC
MISPVPEFTTLPRDNTNDKFLIVASDGIWDVLSNEKCSQLMLTIFSEGEESAALACEELLDQCYAKGSLDNMTAILLRFASQRIGCGGGVVKRRKQRKSR